MLKRSMSNPNLVSATQTIQCYGVSQGHYSIKNLLQVNGIGTGSLGSCFAFIARRGHDVFLAHVAAGNTYDSIREALDGMLIGDLFAPTPAPLRCFLVAGVSGLSQQTQLVHAQLLIDFPTATQLQTVTGSTVCTLVGVQTGVNIQVTNGHQYQTNNTAGAQQHLNTAVQQMS